jgi:hypothetical protein
MSYEQAWEQQQQRKAAEESAALLAEAEAAEILHKRKEEEALVNKWTEGTQVVWKGTANSHCASWLTTGKRYTVRKYNPSTKYLTITTDRAHKTQIVDPSEVSVVPMVEPLEKEEPAVVAHRFKVGDRFTWPGKSNMARASIIKDHTYTVETLMDTGHGPGVKFRTHTDGRFNYIHECDIEKVNSYGASSVVHNAKEVGKNMSEKLNTFWNNNYNIIIWIILALLADNYFFKGAFQDKVKELISGALDHTKKAISADEA